MKHLTIKRIKCLTNHLILIFKEFNKYEMFDIIDVRINLYLYNNIPINIL